MTAVGERTTADVTRDDRAFWRYYAASTVSHAGTAVTAVALPLVAVTVLHAGSLAVASLTAATYAAWVLIGLPAGVIVHRLPLRGVQVSMDVVRAAALLSVPVAAWLGVLGLGQLVAVALAVGLADVVFDVGNSTFLASVVPKAELTRRNSLTQGTGSVVETGGPGIGGLLVQLVGAAGAIVVDVVSYLVSAVLLLGLPRPSGAYAQGRGTSVLASVREGWRYVRHDRTVGPATAVATAINFVAGGFLALTVVFLVRSTGASPAVVGVLTATSGAGSVVGAVICPRLARRIGTARACLASSLVGCAVASLMPLASHGWGWLLFAAGNLGVAAADTIGSILFRTHRQQTVPPALLSRVMATVRFVSWGVIPLGALVAGGIAAVTDPRTALWVFAGLTVAEPATLWFTGLGRRRDLTD